MVAYIVTCFFSMYVLSLIYRLMAVSFSLRLYFFMVVCACLLFLNHILAPVHIFIPAGVLYVLYVSHNSKSRILLIAAIPLLVVAANIFWLVPVFSFFSDKTVNPDHYEFTLQIKNIFEPLHVYGDQRRTFAYCLPVLNSTFIEVLLFLFGATGCFLWWKNGRRRLAAAFDLFNVRWVVCWFEESRQVFDSFPGYFRPIGIIDKFTFYEVLRKPSFFLKGSGTVQVDYNRIILSDLQPEDNEIIISYHWMKYSCDR